MDTLDRSSSNTPARFPGEPPRPATPVPAPFPRDLATTQTPQINPKVVVRGLTRHWWRIALLSAIISAPIGYGIWSTIQPTYEAFSVLKVEPSLPYLFLSLRDDPVQPYIESQLALLTSNKVLEVALASKNVANQPMLRDSKDPQQTLRENLKAGIYATYMIRVSMSSTVPEEAMVIVNAVVQAYLDQHREDRQLTNRLLKEALNKYVDAFGDNLKKKTTELTELVARSHVQVQSRPAIRKPAPEDGDGGQESSFASITDMQYFQLADALMKIDLELIEARAEFKTASEHARDQAARAVDPRDDEDLLARMKEEFLRDPEVIPLVERIEVARDHLEHAKSVVRQDSDPSVVAVAKELRRLMNKYDDLWNYKYDDMIKRLPGQDGSPKLLADLQSRILKLEAKRERTSELLESFKGRSEAQNNDSVKASLLQSEINSLMGSREHLDKKVTEIEFQNNQELYKVSLIDAATVPKVASNNKRLKYMAMAPVGVVGVMLMLFLILEVRAERVADPDALSMRVQSEVYALPPLPTARALRKSKAPGGDDQIGRFIQRLDHLRFAVCGNAAELDQGRCMLITSAIAGEGKTTLAAQLAARCGNSGISTLLIDADLRRGALCSLLDVPEGPGLCDALEGDGVDPRQFVIPVQGGAFHLLPAGALLQDTSRVLQDRKFGLLIAQFRQDYDLILIDAPPVLPVPDPLIMGRWCDGVVLAVRYDISRFPQVERARRQLDNAGIPVLGTVINGMRNTDSYYGHYSYDGKRSSSSAGRSSSPQPDSSNAL